MDLFLREIRISYVKVQQTLFIVQYILLLNWLFWHRCTLEIIYEVLKYFWHIYNILSNIYDRDLFKASIFRCDEIHSFFCGFLREDFALLFYFSSYSLFFFLFYKFNAKFKESFVDIMVKLKLMKKKTKVIELFKLEI